MGLARALASLEDQLTPEQVLGLFLELGLDFPESLLNDPAFINALNAASDTARILPDRVASLSTAIDSSELSQILEESGNLIQAISSLTRSMDSLIRELGSRGNNFLGLSQQDFSEFTQKFTARLFDFLVVRYLRGYHPLTLNILALLGIIEFIITDAGSRESNKPAVTHSVLKLRRIGKILQNPLSTFEEVYGWGTPNLRGSYLLRRLYDILRSFGVAAAFDAPNEGAPAIRMFGLRVGMSSGTSMPGLVLSLDSELADGFSLQLPHPVPGWVIEFSLIGNLPAGLEIALLPPSRLKLHAPSDHVEGEALLRVFAVPQAPAETLELLSVAGGPRLEAQLVTFGIRTFLLTEHEEPVVAEIGIFGGKIFLEMGQADGFLANLSRGGSIEADFDVRVLWSPTQGARLQGSGSLETTLPLHVSSRFVSIEKISLALGINSQGLELQSGVSGVAQIGPLTATVEQLGIFSKFEFTDDNLSGNLGLVNLSLGFKPPTGLGLLIDAGPVVGGGFLAFDHPRGRYSGILQLEMFGIGVTAIGLLATKDSTGQPLPPPGFSLLMIISVEFPSIQLGFGFTLNGVGGLIGIHRTLITQALQDGVREGSVDHIMFPEDPLRNMPQIIGDLGTVFPSRMNRFVFGPMALIGWGTPTLVRIELGIVLEVPDPIRLVLLGQMDVQLPSENAPILELHVDVVGILDFDKKLFSIDASLYDSRVAAFSVYGDMAFRLGWGARPVFALAIGGLNPNFLPPPNFPALRRATVSLGIGDNPRIGIQGYFAVTSNSLQFGARAELYAAAAGFNVYGWLEFHALFIFNPFYFRFDFSLGFALRKGRKRIFGISISGTLDGPNPFHFRGEGCISILFFDLCIGVDVTFGPRRDQVPLPSKDPWIPLKEAIEDERHWNAVLPPATHIAVTLKNHSVPEKQILVHPMGTVTLRQQVVPLNHLLEKFGEFALGVGSVAFELVQVMIGSQEITKPNYDEVRDLFAPGNFEQLSDAEKLSRDSFEQMVAGIAVGSRRVKFGAQRQRILRYETSIVDSPWDSRPVNAKAHITQSRTTQIAGSRHGAKAFSGLRRTGPTKFTSEVKKSKAFSLKEELFCIAKTEDLKPVEEFGQGMTQGQARRKLKAHLAKRPQDRERFQIVPEQELQEVS